MTCAGYCWSLTRCRRCHCEPLLWLCPSRLCALPWPPPRAPSSARPGRSPEACGRRRRSYSHPHRPQRRIPSSVRARSAELQLSWPVAPLPCARPRCRSRPTGSWCARSRHAVQHASRACSRAPTRRRASTCSADRRCGEDCSLADSRHRRRVAAVNDAPRQPPSDPSGCRWLLAWGAENCDRAEGASAAAVGVQDAHREWRRQRLKLHFQQPRLPPRKQQRQAVPGGECSPDCADDRDPARAEPGTPHGRG